MGTLCSRAAYVSHENWLMSLDHDCSSRDPRPLAFCSVSVPSVISEINHILRLHCYDRCSRPRPDSIASYSTRMTTLHPKAPASRIAQARQPRRRRLMMAFQPLSAQIARTMISRSEPNCLRRDGMRILDSALGGSILDAWLLLDVSVLGRLLAPRGGVGSCSWGVGNGSRPNSEEMELMRDRDAICGEDGGAMPVMQSITSTRPGRFADEDRLLTGGT